MLIIRYVYVKEMFQWLFVGFFLIYYVICNLGFCIWLQCILQDRKFFDFEGDGCCYFVNIIKMCFVLYLDFILGMDSQLYSRDWEKCFIRGSLFVVFLEGFIFFENYNKFCNFFFFIFMMSINLGFVYIFLYEWGEFVCGSVGLL